MASLDELSKRFRRLTGQDFQRAVIGDADGVVYASAGDPSVLWVRKQQANGTLGVAVKVPNEAQLRPDAGTPVYLVYNKEDQLVIGGINRDAALTAGINYAANNAADPNAHYYMDKGAWVEALCFPISTTGSGGTASLSVGVKSWAYIYDGDINLFLGDTIDLTSSVPSSGNWRLALVYMNTSGAIAASNSTAQTEDIDPIDDTDMQECIDAATNMLSPIAFWRLRGGQTDITNEDLYLDFRQFVMSSEPVAYPLDLEHGGTEADLSTSGPGPVVQDGAGSAFTVPSTLKHEYGGLETDASAYDGLVKISAGATSEVSLPLELENGGTEADLSGTGPGAVVQTGAGAVLSVETLDETRGGTGQSSYTKGDLLAASDASTLNKLGVGTNNQVLTADSGETTGMKWATPTDTSATAWGGNLIPNYPSIEGADGAQPDWWDVEDANVTLTEEDATGEGIPQKHERVLKIVTGASGANKWVGRVIIPTDEDIIDASVSKVSCSVWVYQASAGTITLELYDVSGSSSISTDTTTTTGSWVLLSIENETFPSGNMRFQLTNTSNSVTYYAAMPMLNVGEEVLPYRQRDIVYRPVYQNVLSTTSPATSWTDIDCSSYVDTLACMLQVHSLIMNDTAFQYKCSIRRNGSSTSFGNTSILAISTYNNSLSYALSSRPEICDDGQIIEYIAGSYGAASVGVYIYITGYWRWV